MSASMDQLPAEDWQALCMDELNRRKNLGRKLEEAQEEIHQLKKQIAAAPTPAAQGAVENGVVLLKGLLPTVQNAVLEEMVRLILAHRPPAVQGGDAREAVARHLCLLKTGRDGFTGWDLIHEVEKANWRGEADKILSLIHPQPGREEAK